METVYRGYKWRCLQGGEALVEPSGPIEGYAEGLIAAYGERDALAEARRKLGRAEATGNCAAAAFEARRLVALQIILARRTALRFPA